MNERQYRARCRFSAVRNTNLTDWMNKEMNPRISIMNTVKSAASAIMRPKMLSGISDTHISLSRLYRTHFVMVPKGYREYRGHCSDKDEG